MAVNPGASIRQKRKEAWRGQSAWQPVVDKEREAGGLARGPDRGGEGTLLGSDGVGVTCKIQGAWLVETWSPHAKTQSQFHLQNGEKVGIAGLASQG